MTKRSELTDKITESRRSLLKKGAVTSAVLGLGLTGTAMAQDDGGNGGDGGFDEDDLFVEEESQKGLIFRRNFRPNVPFTVVSDVIEFTPDVEEIEDNVWSNYNTRIIRYVDTDEHLLFFPANAAEMGPFDDNLGFVPDSDAFEEGALDDGELSEDELTGDAESMADVRPQLFVMDIQTELLGDAEFIVTAQFSEVREESEEGVFNEVGEIDFNPRGGAAGNETVTGNETVIGNESVDGNETNGTNSTFLGNGF